MGKSREKKSPQEKGCEKKGRLCLEKGRLHCNFSLLCPFCHFFLTFHSYRLKPCHNSYSSNRQPRIQLHIWLTFLRSSSLPQPPLPPQLLLLPQQLSSLPQLFLLPQLLSSLPRLLLLPKLLLLPHQLLPILLPDLQRPYHNSATSRQSPPHLLST